MSVTDARPNLILVSIDSLRADHCGFLGADSDLTPTMDRLASEGVAFRNAIATGPQTFSSMPAVFTGRHRPQTTLQSNTEIPHWQRRLVSIRSHFDRYGSLPERLQRLGYETAGFSPNPWMSANAGADRGFDHFADRSGSASDRRSHWLTDRVPARIRDRKSVEIGLDLLTSQSFFAKWEDYYGDLRATVRDLSEPYFLWVFLMDTHFPFITGRSHREEQSLVGMYASMLRSEGALRGDVDALADDATASAQRSYRDTVRAVDAFLERLLADTAGDDPALFVHADHGESFGEHGSYGHHHRQVFEENVHVPYLVHNAGAVGEVEAPTSLATIHDAVLQTAREGRFESAETAAEAVFTASECGRNQAVRSDRVKYIRSRDEELLFDLERDPDETANLADERPDLRREYERRLDEFVEHHEEVDRLAQAVRNVASVGGL